MDLLSKLDKAIIKADGTKNEYSIDNKGNGHTRNRENPAESLRNCFTSLKKT